MPGQTMQEALADVQERYVEYKGHDLVNAVEVAVIHTHDGRLPLHLRVVLNEIRKRLADAEGRVHVPHRAQ